MKTVWRYLLIVVAALLAWRIVVVGMTDHYVDMIVDGDKAAIDKALSWSPGNPIALFFKAEQIYEQNPVAAERMLQSSIHNNPADSRPLLLLARIRLANGDADVADSMMDVALRLTPSNPRVLMNAAQYWYERGSIDKAVDIVSTALIADPTLKSELLPVFLEIAESPDNRQALEPLAENPPEWWEDFFVEVAKKAKDIDSVRVLFDYRRASAAYPPTTRERHEYIARLRREGLLAEAYLRWVNDMNQDELHALGYLYNGGFELEFSDTGFGWHAGNLGRTGILLNTAKTYGITGEAALHLAFSGKYARFNHLYQPLRLDEGTYQLIGEVRLDKLKTSGGLQWTIRCTVGSNERLAQSDLFRGASEWVDFTIDFKVPEGCIGQELRLVSTGRRKADHEIRGEAWFDEMAIRLVREAEE